MDEHAITLTMAGRNDEGGHVRLADFVRQLERLQGSLASIDRALSRGERTAYYRIVALSHSSPATVVLEPRPAHEHADPSQVVTRFADALGMISRGSVPAGLDVRALKDLRDLAGEVGRGLDSASIVVGGDPYELTPRFASTITVALAEVHPEIGSIEGTIERFNVHNRANVFYLYPAVGPTSVACHFRDELREKAKTAILTWATVTGTLKYLTHAAFPHEVDVQDIEIHQAASDLVDPESLRGGARGATGDQSSEDFVRGSRDDWD